MQIDFKQMERDAKVARECQEFLNNIDRAHGVRVTLTNTNRTDTVVLSFFEGSSYGTGAALLGCLRQSMKDEIAHRSRDIQSELQRVE